MPWKFVIHLKVVKVHVSYLYSKSNFIIQQIFINPWPHDPDPTVIRNGLVYTCHSTPMPTHIHTYAHAHTEGDKGKLLVKAVRDYPIAN